MSTEKPLLLAGDIGGTKTNLAVFAADNPYQSLVEASFVSAAYRDLETMLDAFLAECGLRVHRAAFGVAGPVIEGVAKITKLSWLVDAASIKTAFQLADVVVVNDLVATAHGIFSLQADDLLCLNPGTPVEHGPLAVIAPGTGLGEAMLFWDGERYQPQATEGGHALFSPANRQQLALAAYLFDRGCELSFDALASGRGLPLLYDFVKQAGGHEEPAWLAQTLAASADPSPVITQVALDPMRANSLCQATLRLFVEIIAVEAANLALKALSTGGLFIGGGIPPRMISMFREVFVTAFVGQRTLATLLAAMPIHLISNPRTALLGAARLASQVS